ncbi:hypothetical protein VIBNISO65_1170002 [Vibrio nigripulchritudo SO65]|uniref:hypothetical protein n=1 Tax=Vibrio nigripulchritudo TaxID=28173 RepID=UPI0003B1DE44|nr:hypothetical protein [Vibrio nigripulchritudo]CCN37471.1 hypothetical protein VIBNIAM115_600016 [Vibrio nigripulchritudo AM115]CCN44851.1 hypothetical protein VIBNIFTn2_930027 [Vibrio nigripulchritudo FTn2]CCN67963.1 hypothetical protein VIBNIPon4_900017 [Vibrio nigripulchritudo POn4]CCN74778.1 hypothetical protein VIBNISO65_1170002 [Vibrio nigripulchritudo SO65]
MNSVFKRAQGKKLSHRKAQDSSGVCEKSEADSRQLLQQFQDVIQHFEENAKDEDKCRDVLRKLYESHESCFSSQKVTGPHE